MTDVDPELLRLEGDVALPGEVGDDDPLVVSHPFRLDVLVGLRVLGDGAHMDAPLVGEGAPADEGAKRDRPDVRDFAHVVREVRQLPQRCHRDARPVHLELEVRDDGGQIGVPAPLAVAVDRSLDHRHARLNGRDGVGHGETAVVVGVDAEAFGGDDLRHLLHGRRQIVGERSAVRVAQDDPVRPGGKGRLQGREGVGGVSPVPVEEMLRVEDHLLAPSLQKGDRVADDCEVFLEGDPEDLGDVEVPALPEDGDGGCFRLEEGLEVPAVFGAEPRFAGAPEGGQPGVTEGDFLRHLEEAGVLGVGARPSPLDVVESHLVKPPGDPQLLLGREIDVFPLRAVPQGRVVDEYLRCFHCPPLPVKKIRYRFAPDNGFCRF